MLFRWERSFPREFAGIITSGILPDVLHRLRGSRCPSGEVRVSHGELDPHTLTVAVELEAREEKFIVWGYQKANNWTGTPGVLHKPRVEPPESCAECGGHRHRKYFLVSPDFLSAQAFNPTAAEAQWVGSTCIENRTHPNYRLFVANNRDELDLVDNFLWGAKTAGRFETLRTIAEAMHSIRHHGYESSRFGGGTKVRVENAIFQSPDEVSPDAATYTLPAAMLIGWAAEQTPENEFEASVFYLAQQPTVSRYCLGALVYLPELHRRALAAEHIQVRYSDNHFGEEGKRYSELAMLRESRQIRPDLYLHVFQAQPGGERLVWFTSKSLGGPAPVSIGLSFTVKRHDAFRGEPSTVITRAHILSTFPR